MTLSQSTGDAWRRRVVRGDLEGLPSRCGTTRRRRGLGAEAVRAHSRGTGIAAARISRIEYSCIRIAHSKVLVRSGVTARDRLACIHLIGFVNEAGIARTDGGDTILAASRCCIVLNIHPRGGPAAWLDGPAILLVYRDV